MSSKQENNEQKVFGIFYGMGLFFIVVAFVFTPSIAELINGYKFILLHPSILDFDTLKMAGQFGTGFLNMGILCLISTFLLQATKTKINGLAIASLFIVTGFALYGKNPLNSFFPVFGVYLEGILFKKKFSTVTPIALFSTCLAPVFSVLAFGTEPLGFAKPLGIFIGVVFGVAGGYFLAKLAPHIATLHGGLTLYNAGFTAGFIGIITNAIIKSFGIGHDAFPYRTVSTLGLTTSLLEAEKESDFVMGHNFSLGIVLFILFAYLFLAGLALGGKNGYVRMMKRQVLVKNLVDEYQLSVTLMNVATIGFVGLGFTLLVGGQLSGPVIAAMVTAAGFAANGVFVATIVPTILGVFTMSFLVGGISGVLFKGAGFFAAGLAQASGRGMIASALFTCGISPIVSKYGRGGGFFVSMLHSMVVTTTGSMHGFMCLYNNGFCLSLLTTVWKPIYEKMYIKKEKALRTELA